MRKQALRAALIAAAACLPSAYARAQADAAGSTDDPPTVDLVAQHVTVPAGLDSTQDVTVTLDGQMPTPCYHQAPGKVEFDASSNIFTLTPRATVDAGICIQIIVPYTSVFDLGVLPAGHYRVRAPGLEALESFDIVQGS
jgi:hypothetical protein